MSAIPPRPSHCCGRPRRLRPTPNPCRSRRRLIACRRCRAPMRPRHSPRCSTGSIRTNASRCSRWRRGRCASASRRGSPRPRSPTASISMSRRSRKCGTASHRPTPRCSTGPSGAGRSRPPPTCRCFARSCSRTRSRNCASISPTMPPSGNGTASASRSSMSPARRGSTAAPATTSPRAFQRSRAISPPPACSTAS